MNLLDAAIMGIVEGASEFLPVSSTGHLIVAGSLLGVQDEVGKVFEIAIQIGAIVAVLWAYRDRFTSALTGLGRDVTANRFIINLIIAFLPVAIVGLFLHKYITAYLFNAYGVATAQIIGAFVILWVERKRTDNGLPQILGDSARVMAVDAITLSDALKIGLAQCLGLFPGMSRSGSTLIGGILFGLSRKAATEFSFFLGVPTLAAAGLYSLYKDRALLSISDIPAFAVGTAVSFVLALIVIRWLIRFIANHSLRMFAWYRIAFGLLILLSGMLGWIKWPTS